MPRAESSLTLCESLSRRGQLSSRTPVTAGLLFMDFSAFLRFRTGGGQLTRFEQLAHPAPRVEAVQCLASRSAHLDVKAARHVTQSHASRGPVRLLAAGAAGSDEALLQVLFAETAMGHPLKEFRFFPWCDAECRHGRAPNQGLQTVQDIGCLA